MKTITGTIIIILTLIKLSLGNNTTDFSFREPKFWPVGIVRIANDVCSTLEGFVGTCYTRSQCRQINGIPSGTCAGRVGRCCLVQRTCGDTSSYNNTYFTNTGFPNPVTGTTQCIFTVRRCNSDICQLRLNFLSLTLAQPDGNGNCVTDSLRVIGGASTVPIICGENSGQHIYVNFNGDNPIRIVISTGAASTLARTWSIMAIQIGCDCPTLAPSGCLMYYTGLSGTVISFNYGTTINGNLLTTTMGLRPGTREMVNLNYGVCIQMQPGYCSIQWSQGSDPTSFTVSGDTATAEALSGLPSFGMIGTACTTDYVVIPNPTYATGTMAGTSVDADRFCGNAFPTVTSSSKPFVLTVVTDANEGDAVDIANRGFSLTYTQVACSTNLDPLFI